MIMNKDIYILAIETSCDETAASVVRNGREILSNVVYSQIEIHMEFGGVVPEIASRKHVEKIDSVVDKAIKDSGLMLDQIDAIAVTYGPGLVGALLVGLSYAKALAYSLEKPLVGVNHLDGHICANYLAFKDLKPPFISLLVSGGHTNIIDVEDYGVYKVIGKTRDDAIGEAYDKVARTLGLPYPGGPAIDTLARKGDPKAINFTKPYISKDSYEFSFSGIKSAVLSYINSQKMKNLPIVSEDVAASFQESALTVLVDKLVMAAREYGHDKVVLAGGVASNSMLREKLHAIEGLEFMYPPVSLCTDNAAMIASAGYFRFIKGDFADLELNAVPSLKL